MITHGNYLNDFLACQAYQLRKASLEMTTHAGSGHPTSCLSAADLVAALFFYAMRYDPHNYNNPNNDRFILSKGHAAPLLYAAWHLVGELSYEDLLTYREFGSPLEGHPTPRFAYADVATGSLGMGLSYGVGMSYAARMDKLSYRTYVLLGDAELAEGSVWEAAEIAATYKLNNLIALVDCNRLGQSSESLHGAYAEHWAQKFNAFGFKSIIINGHDIKEIMQALDEAHATVDQPVVIIAKTVKGYGIASVENKQGYHGKAFSKQELPAVLEQLANHFPLSPFTPSDCERGEQLYRGVPFNCGSIHFADKVAQNTHHERICNTTQTPAPLYKQADAIATRKAYGQALTAIGHTCEAVISLDAEVKNSTYADIFEQQFPERFIQCFVAEQNMVSMAVGLQRRGKIPFVSTFAAFFSRAHDQIRMAAIGRCPLRLVGSHAGVSIGQDGPSQMGLEDIALMRSVPESIVVYPCDAVSTFALVGLMAKYEDGISYLRTTRMETPVIYSDNDTFTIGGCHVLRSSDNDSACVVAAGITVVEALKAYDELLKQNIHIAVIDLYSIKPLDVTTLVATAMRAGKRIITVEDHYYAGGIGEAVAFALRDHCFKIQSLAVPGVPGSGKPAELLAWAGIDADAIVRAVAKF